MRIRHIGSQLLSWCDAVECLSLAGSGVTTAA
jgi:hypothetical protein